MSYKLEKPFTDKQRADFIVEHNHNNGLLIQETDVALYALEAWELLEGDTVVDNMEEYQAEQSQKEEERINGLSITRSDFFDATIKAFGADESDFLPIIEDILAQIPDTLQIMEDIPNSVAIKIALNNYKNAAGFYRKHPLFMILSNVPIKISEALTITITPEQWDKFFDKTDKKNPDAYKELLPIVVVEENTETEKTDDPNDDELTPDDSEVTDENTTDNELPEVQEDSVVSEADSGEVDE